MKRILLLLLTTSTLLVAQKPPKSAAEYCLPGGGKGAVMCGASPEAACIMLHPDICGLEDPMPNCCAASPEAADRKAVRCGCCGAKK